MTLRLNGRISERALRVALRMAAEAVESARLVLAKNLATADGARHAQRAAIAAIGEEAQAATDLAADDLAVEAFAAWLPTGRSHVAAAALRRDQAEADIVLARATLASARSAEAATEALLAQRATARRARDRRVEQVTLDEAAARASLRRGDAGPAG